MLIEPLQFIREFYIMSTLQQCDRIIKLLACLIDKAEVIIVLQVSKHAYLCDNVYTY
jgi:acetone carboxylase gamma subunit